MIAGAGPAGCAAAALLAERGHQVLLVERGAVPHPRLCTHAIMPAGLDVLARMGVLDQAEAAGAQRWWGVRLHLDGVTVAAPLPAGWTRHAYGLSLRRHLLDPLLLAAACRCPAVSLRLGWSAEALLGRDGVITGVRLHGPGGAVQRVRARLVVAAGGRHSRLVRAARPAERVLPNRHTALIAYLDGVPDAGPAALEGFYDRGRSASLLPADGGLHVAGVMAPSPYWRREEWPARLLAALRAYPELAPRLRAARIVTAPVTVRGLRNVLRRPVRPGFAAIGDAAAQTDPAFGQGISWALRSGARLADAADAALRQGAGPVCLPARQVWEPVFAPLFAGISLLSLLSPGSTAERLVVASVAQSPRTSAAALRLLLGLGALPRPAPARQIAAAWAGGALARPVAWGGADAP